jgi:predicted ArsR family transcriptional regulator
MAVMTTEIQSSDVAILDLLRKRDSLTISELVDSMGVTATAVRQRLNRLLAQGLIERQASKEGRGRPSHHYALTNKGRRKTGANFADLAIALWQEVRAIRDPEVRIGLLQRLAKRLVDQYGDELTGRGLTEKLDSLAKLFNERQIPFEVDRSNPLLPVLNALACPYPDLAEQDRSICSLEKMMFSELLGENVKLAECRLDGGKCCSFQPSSS